MKHPKFKSLVVLVVFLLGQFKNYVPKLPILKTFKAQVFPFDDGTYNPSSMNKCFPFVFSWKQITCLLELHVKKHDSNLPHNGDATKFQIVNLEINICIMFCLVKTPQLHIRPPNNLFSSLLNSRYTRTSRHKQSR
jgi:hypothetical protein